jgi:hypothetical protein
MGLGESGMDLKGHSGKLLLLYSVAFQKDTVKTLIFYTIFKQRPDVQILLKPTSVKDYFVRL